MDTVGTRLPREAHTSRPWRIHQIAPEFEVLDVWRLPTTGGSGDFHRLLAVMRSLDAERSSPVVHALFAARWALGWLFRWDGSSDGIDSRVPSLRDRLPVGCGGGGSVVDEADSSPADALSGRFAPLYATDDEAALEIANRTVHGVLHLGWVPDGSGGHHGQMAILVKPNGLFGAGYLAAIAPFRHLIVYPAMLRAIGRAWRDQAPATASVRQVDPPEDVRDLSTLARVDYADAFVVETATCPDWTAEGWARVVLEGAPAELRAKLLSSWTALGLKNGTCGEAILGWEVRHASPETLLLGRDSRVGMPGELLFMRRPAGLLFATFIHHQTAVTRPLWASVEHAHVRTVSALLERACRAAADEVTESAAAGRPAGPAVEVRARGRRV
ncbi:MAG: hypothetical protein QOD90_217 [Mycobacterium sp.]|nr:hypothetical protein [Mycobacterium sp.]